MKSRGIIYVATGERHLREMLFSAESAKKYFPDLPITLFTDAPSIPLIKDNALIDNIEVIENPLYSFGDKIGPLQRSPYDETLFLDTDTIVVNSCEEIFEPLKNNDIAVTFNGYRRDFDFEEVPHSFPSYNTGVIAFRKSAAFTAFIEDWISKQGDYVKFRPDDQPSFRYCVSQGNIKLHTLPCEYNFYPHFPCMVGGFSKVKIVHSWGPFAAEAARILDRSGKGPVIFGPIELKVILFWYWTKFRKVVRRWMKVRWR